MKIVINDEALQWFKDEMEVEKGDFVNFLHVMVVLAHYMMASL